MFDVIRKKEFFEWCERGVIPNLRILEELRARLPEAWWLLDIKSAEDGWILSEIGSAEDKRIAEIGGSDSRILPAIGARNEYWNIDPLRGEDGGAVYGADFERNATVVRGRLGEFLPDLAADYFDFVVSVSVIEHLPPNQLEAFFADMYRITKPGGCALHAIDMYLGDSADADTSALLARILGAAAAAGFVPLSGQVVDTRLSLSSDYATHSDMGLMAWNQSVPAMRSHREEKSVVAIKAGWRKPRGGPT